MVCDTSGLLAAFDRDQRSHAAARAALQDHAGPRILSPFVLAELDYFVAGRMGADAEAVLLEDVAHGAYRLEELSADDVGVAAGVVSGYRDLGVGLADASIVVLAARHRTTKVLTLDRRHFAAMRPLWGEAFELLPAA
jgi:predicted nucleic acid-binding protein